jgi:hypothetical protein
MGVENNECVIATTWNNDAMQKVKDWVAELDDEKQSLFAFVPSLINAKETLFLAPDGSKKGWATAKQGEVLRSQLIELLESFDYEDSSSPFDWVEVGYGEFGQTILRGNCQNKYGDEPYAT